MKELSLEKMENVDGEGFGACAQFAAGVAGLVGTAAAGVPTGGATFGLFALALVFTADAAAECFL